MTNPASTPPPDETSILIIIDNRVIVSGYYIAGQYWQDGGQVAECVTGWVYSDDVLKLFL